MFTCYRFIEKLREKRTRMGKLADWGDSMTQKEDTKEWGKNREGIDTAHKLTVTHILDSRDLPRIERLIKCLCTAEHCITRVGKSREQERTRMGNEGEIRMEDINADTERRDEWGNKERRNRHWHKLTVTHIRDSGDLPRIERLIKLSCEIKHCITRVGKSIEEKENKNMGNEGEIRMDGIGIHLLKKPDTTKRGHERVGQE